MLRKLSLALVLIVLSPPSAAAGNLVLGDGGIVFPDGSVQTTAAAVAGNGVLEIHPDCAATGCFPGDAPGLPVEIAQPGSYRLTGNLQVPDEDTTAILVQSDDVAIDLDGFAIHGVTTCGLTSCQPVGTGAGIHPFAQTGVSVRGGAVRGMGETGVLLGRSTLVGVATILGNTIAANAGFGIHVDADASAGYGQNMLQDNQADPELQVSGVTAKELGTNVCQGDTVCP